MDPAQRSSRHTFRRVTAVSSECSCFRDSRVRIVPRVSCCRCRCLLETGSTPLPLEVSFILPLFCMARPVARTLQRHMATTIIIPSRDAACGRIPSATDIDQLHVRERGLAQSSRTKHDGRRRKKKCTRRRRSKCCAVHGERRHEWSCLFSNR